MPLLAVQGLTKLFGRLVAVDHVDLAIEAGEVVGLIGPNGAGKSTLVNLISGFEPPSEGAVAFAGRPLDALGAPAIARLGLARTFQIAQPFRAMTVRQNVAVPALFRAAPVPSVRAALREADHLLESVGLGPKAALPAGALTTPALRRAEVAKALALRPRLTFPAAGMAGPTLLRVLSGLLRPERGRVAFQQRAVTGLPPERLVHLGIAHVPQGRRLFSDLSVRENLLLGAWARRERAAIAADLEHMLDLFPALADRLALPARQLSGGEQQMAAVARALMARPRLLLIDEPSLGLAPLAVRALMEVVVRLRREGVSILLVEQDVTVALGHADRGYVLETGRIVLADRAAVLLENPQVRRVYLGLTARS